MKIHKLLRLLFAIPKKYGKIDVQIKVTEPKLASMYSPIDAIDLKLTKLEDGSVILFIDLT